MKIALHTTQCARLFLAALLAGFPIAASGQHWDGAWAGSIICGPQGARAGYFMEVTISVVKNNAAITRSTNIHNWLGINGRMKATDLQFSPEIYGIATTEGSGPR